MFQQNWAVFLERNTAFFVLEELSLGYIVNCIYFSLTSKTSLCNGSAFANSSTSTYIHAKEFVILQNVSAIFGWYLISSSEWANFLNKEQKNSDQQCLKQILSFVWSVFQFQFLKWIKLNIDEGNVLKRWPDWVLVRPFQHIIMATSCSLWDSE